MGTDLSQFVEFGLGNELFAVRINEVHEIIRMQEITHVPNAREHLRGVINLRGTVVPVFALWSGFGLEEHSATKLSRIVVVLHDTDIVGLLVDRVTHVIRFQEIFPVPDAIDERAPSCFLGIGQTDHGLVSVLNLAQVLNV